MKEGWEQKTLGAVCSFLNRGVSPKYVNEGGVVVLNQRCVRDHRISFDVARRHDDRAKTVNTERFVRAGDVLVNSTGTGTLGRVAQIRTEPAEPTTVDSHVTIVRPLPGIFVQEFFGYMLRDIEDELKESGDGCGGQTELSRTVVAEKFSVRFPKALNEQHRLVSILDEAFAGIATAKENAEKNLENARAIFESELNAIFNRRGKGWVEQRLGDIFEIGSSKRIHEREWTSTGIPFYGGREIVQLAKRGSADSNAYISASKYEEYAAKHEMPRSGDILMTARGTIGVGYIVKNGDKFYYKDGNVISLRQKVPVSQKFILYAFESKSVKEKISDLSGTTVIHLSIEKAKELRLCLPAADVQSQLTEKLDMVRTETQRLASIYERKLAELDALKKSLLHHAFTGQL